MRHARCRTARCPGVLLQFVWNASCIIYDAMPTPYHDTAREMISWHPSQSGGINRLTRLVAVAPYSKLSCTCFVWAMQGHLHAHTSASNTESLDFTFRKGVLVIGNHPRKFFSRRAIFISPCTLIGNVSSIAIMQRTQEAVPGNSLLLLNLLYMNNQLREPSSQPHLNSLICTTHFPL